MIREKVVELMAKQLKVDPATVTDESRMVEDLGADSANLMIMMMDLEDAFDIQVEDSAIVTLKTVGDVVAYIENAQE
ncbi:MAG TPA: acyl carrier protein [Clostridiales bacterium]|nr:acyl carrier protein [Clostridiales bacterium]